MQIILQQYLDNYSVNIMKIKNRNIIKEINTILYIKIFLFYTITHKNIKNTIIILTNEQIYFKLCFHETYFILRE